MRTVTVSASKAYDIHIGSGLLREVGKYVQNLGKVQKVGLITETTVFPLYGNAVISSLEQAGFSVSVFQFPAGEENKNASNFLEALNFLAEQKLTRSDVVLALGGGVVGDLAGFTSACYLRGIRYVQIPTTLLAAVDSSVGGKTAIDLPGGKNLAGAFWQPSLVLCDTDVLSSLPQETFRDGCAEVIKYGVLYDPNLFSTLEKTGLDFDRESVITRCVELKRNVVMEDELDTGARMKLNLGHTIGHGVEARSNFTLSHGKSVAIGMAIISRAVKCPDSERIITLLQKFGLPTTADYHPDDIYRFTLSDKKRMGRIVHLIVPRAIGDCTIMPIAVEDLKCLIEAGL